MYQNIEIYLMKAMMCTMSANFTQGGKFKAFIKG